MRPITPYLLVVIVTLFAVGHFTPQFQQNDAKANSDAEQEPAKPGHRYPGFGFLPPPKAYEGRVFKLSQDYPQNEPDPKDIPEIATRDFENVKTHWKQYLLDVRSYCFKGNVGTEDVEDDWRVENNKEVKWYHMPWQHFGPLG